MKPNSGSASTSFHWWPIIPSRTAPRPTPTKAGISAGEGRDDQVQLLIGYQTTNHTHADVGDCTLLVEHPGTEVDERTSNLGMTYLNGSEGKTLEQSTNYINANGVGPERDGSQLMTISELWGDQR